MKSFIESLISVSNSIKAFINEKKDISFKKDFSDLVTNYDVAMEDKFVKLIKDNFPDSSIVSEEGERIKRAENDVFYVDPIDGTTNFAHSLPLCATSIARVVGGEPIFGFISVPILDWHLYAIKDKGSFLNFERINVSDNSTLDVSLFSTGFRNYSKSKNVFDFLSDKIQALRMFGSAATAMSMVSMGKIELYWEYGLYPWDIAAGKIIIEEAGGKVVDSSLNDFLIFNDHTYNIIAYNGLLKIEEVFGQ